MSDCTGAPSPEEEELLAAATQAAYSGKLDECARIIDNYSESFQALLQRTFAFGRKQIEHYLLLSQPDADKQNGFEPHFEERAKWEERESQLRKVAEGMAVLVRVGMGRTYGPYLQDVWNRIAMAIIAQKAGREASAQKILLELMSQTLADPHSGPHSLKFLSRFFNLCSTFASQEKHEVAGRLFHMGLILAKYGHNGEKDMKLIYDVLGQLFGCQKDIKHFSSAEVFSREAVEVAQQIGDVALECTALMHHGVFLFEQGKAVQAEPMLERALSQRLKMTGEKAVTQSLEELKALSVKRLKEMLKDHGLGIPSGCEKEDLALFLWDKAVKDPSRPIKDAITFSLMSKYAGSLCRQREDSPEKLPKAACLFRQVVAALRVHPEYGQDDGGYLGSTDDLADTLCYQYKYVEAIDIRTKALAVRKRVIGVKHPTYVYSIGAIKDIQRDQQKAFGGAGKGPQSSYPADTDDYPASVLFQATVQKAREKRAKAQSSSTSTDDDSTSTRAFPYVPIAYNPADVRDVNLSALIAGLGAGDFREEADGMGVEWHCRSLSSTGIDPQSKDVWAQAMNLVKTSMSMRGELPNVSEIPVTESLEELKALRIKVLVQMLEQRHISIPRGAEKDDLAALLHSHFAKGPTRSILLKLKGLNELAAENGLIPCIGLKEFMEQEAKELKRLEEMRQQKSSLPLDALGKPMHVCIGCGKRASKMMTCTGCKKARACSRACFEVAWRTHKNSCERQDKVKKRAGL